MPGSWTQNWTRFRWRPLRSLGGDHLGWRPPWSCVGGPCPFSFIPWHLSYKWGKSWKTSVRVAEQCWVLHVASTWPPYGGGLDWPAIHPSSSGDREGLQTALGRRRCLPSRRTKGFPHQVSLSQSSRLMPWCGRRRKESPNPREFTCYQRTKVRRSQCEDSLIVALAASGYGCGQRTSRPAVRSPS
jgi:hypothetical protein